MRAARLLRILLILQNRGRQTSVQLAHDLEVAPRTILRDVDAMTEAGLPIIVHQGNQGGIELGFNHRTRLTGLAQDEAEALGLILSADNPIIAALGYGHAAQQARVKMIESLPDRTRHHVGAITKRFRSDLDDPPDNPRVTALAKAVQSRQIVRLRFATATQQTVHPVSMTMTSSTWLLHDAMTDSAIALADWGRVNVASHTF